jgi:hypothetical protein
MIGRHDADIQSDSEVYHSFIEPGSANSVLQKPLETLGKNRNRTDARYGHREQVGANCRKLT